MSVTKVFVDNFNKQNCHTSIAKWIHDYPTAFKVIRIAGLLLGVAAIATLPFSLPVIGAAAACGVLIGGAISIAASVLSWVFLKYITCAGHDMNERSFQVGECPGGRLYYQNNIPILELTDDPAQTGDQHGYLAGKAHGFLLGSHIYELKKKLDLAVHIVLRQPRASKIKQLLEEVRKTLPESCKFEMRGLSAGYKEWAEKANIATEMNEDDVLLMHLIADSKHFKTKEIAKLANYFMDAAELSGACTSLLHRDPDNGVVFGRNMDWCPFGQGGAKSLIIVWKPQNIAVLGVPGLIGAITGWNQHHLSLAMNVCPGKTTRIRGMPSSLFNRYILEQADSVEAATRLINRARPLGPYHLTLADKSGAGACISFYQGKEEKDHIRFLEEDPLLVVNWRYPDCTGGYFNSKGRTELLQRYFQDASSSISSQLINWRKLINNALKLTNSWITMHSLLFIPKSDQVRISWDNGYAASGLKKRISMSQVFL